jgi:hypothetical protein
MFIVFCYFLVKSFYWKKYALLDGSLYISLNCLLTLSFAAAFTLLTGYYALMFAGLSGLYIVYNSFNVKDRYGEIASYIAILFLGIVIATAFYPNYPLGIISYRATETAQTLFSGFFKNLKLSLLTVFNLLKTHYFTWPVIALCLTAFLYTKLAKKKIVVEKHAAFIFLAAVAYVFIIIFIAPYKTLRYVMPVFPFFVFLPLTLVRAVDNRKIRFGITAALCICFLYGGIKGQALENVYKTKPETYLFREDAKTPVFVMNRSWWKYAGLVPYFADDQEYCFIDSFENDTMTRYGAMYLVMEKEMAAHSSVVLNNFEIESEFDAGYFKCRKLIRKSGVPGFEVR